MNAGLEEINRIPQDEHVPGSETCVICGTDIPEGGHTCPTCRKMWSRAETEDAQ